LIGIMIVGALWSGSSEAKVGSLLIPQDWYRNLTKVKRILEDTGIGKNGTKCNATKIQNWLWVRLKDLFDTRWRVLKHLWTNQIFYLDLLNLTHEENFDKARKMKVCAWDRDYYDPDDPEEDFSGDRLYCSKDETCQPCWDEAKANLSSEEAAGEEVCKEKYLMGRAYEGRTDDYRDEFKTEINGILAYYYDKEMNERKPGRPSLDELMDWIDTKIAKGENVSKEDLGDCNIHPKTQLSLKYLEKMVQNGLNTKEELETEFQANGSGYYEDKLRWLKGVNPKLNVSCGKELV